MLPAQLVLFRDIDLKFGLGASDRLTGIAEER
jgi:hypothetical protein